MKSPFAFLLGVLTGVGATLLVQRVRVHVEFEDPNSLSAKISDQLEVLETRTKDAIDALSS